MGRRRAGRGKRERLRINFCFRIKNLKAPPHKPGKDLDFDLQRFFSWEAALTRLKLVLYMYIQKALFYSKLLSLSRCEF